MSVVTAFCCVVLLAVEQHAPQISELRPVTGILMSQIIEVHQYKASPYAKIEIKLPNGSVENAEIAYICFLWKRCLKSGATLTLLLNKPTMFHGENVYVWSLSDAQSNLLSFEDVLASNMAQRKQYILMFGGLAAGVIVIELIFTVIGYLRKTKHRNPNPSIKRDALKRAPYVKR
jgi:hypothetical protein